MEAYGMEIAGRHKEAGSRPTGAMQPFTAAFADYDPNGCVWSTASSAAASASCSNNVNPTDQTWWFNSLRSWIQLPCPGAAHMGPPELYGLQLLYRAILIASLKASLLNAAFHKVVYIQYPW
ncbi:hypothetical protein Dimus_037756 [Dionaea muscipula]